MPKLVSDNQKKMIRFLYEQRGLGPADIDAELVREFGEEMAASMPTIMRELRKIREEKEREFDWRVDEGVLTKKGFKVTGTKRRKEVKSPSWTVGMKDFTDEDSALISQVLSEALVFDKTTPPRTSIAQARWIARYRKAYPRLAAIIIWHAAKEAELVEYLLEMLEIKVDYRPIDRALQFQPWKGYSERSLYAEICEKERIQTGVSWWWERYVELFRIAEAERVEKETTDEQKRKGRKKT